MSEDLLIKYIAHVMHCEGSNFIPVKEPNGDGWQNVSGVAFTDEEARTLERLADQARDIYPEINPIY